VEESGSALKRGCGAAQAINEEFSTAVADGRKVFALFCSIAVNLWPAFSCGAIKRE